jgi:hypothetical protein
MNTKIGTPFGLALLMVIGVLAAMFAMGNFTPKPVGAAGLAEIDVAITPATAMGNGQYTISVSGGSGGITTIPVGGTITVTFGSKYVVPSTIATSAVKLKATVVSGGTGGTAGRLNDASAITISGRAVTITVPDMDDTSNASAYGDQAIAGHGDLGVGATFTVTFTQAAGIINPERAILADDVDTAATTLTVKTSTDTTAVTATTQTAITSFSKFTPTTATRGSTVTVTGGGFNATCADCKIRLSPQAGTAPTTGAGGVAHNGSGTIDADGVFAGTIVLGAGTKAGGYVWITDKNNYSKVSTTAFVQKPSATPRATSTTPGSTITVDLVDFTTGGAATVALASIKVRNTAVSAYATGWTATTVIPTSGSTSTLVPLKFKLPADVGEGVHKVSITDSGGKVAVFDLTVGLRSVQVSPASAVPGQSIVLSGSGYSKSGTIAATTGLIMKAGTVVTTAPVNTAAISIDSTGSWTYATTMPTLAATSGNGISSTIVFTATDGTLVGVSDTSFKRTAKAVTLSPTTISPGEALTVTVAGFTADNGSQTAYDANFTVTLGTTSGGSEVTLTGTSTFPIGADGTGTGTVTVPTTVSAVTHYVTVTDNAGEVSADSSSNNTKTVSITVPKGAVTVSPTSVSTGNTVTLTGSAFPPATTASVLTIGGANAMPSGGIVTDANGAFTQLVEVPAATTGGSLSPGTQIVSITVGTITGSSTTFSTPSPSITITPATAAVEDSITITGVGFNSLGTVSVLNIGSASALPSPAPRATRNGEITTEVLVPLLNVGSYTVTMTNGSGFSASSTFTATAAKVVAASTADNTETVFADVIANDDSLVRVWRFSNAEQSWNFYDPRPAFASANTLVKTGAGDIVWVNVTAEQTFQGGTLFPGWNLISLN